MFHSAHRRNKNMLHASATTAPASTVRQGLKVTASCLRPQGPQVPQPRLDEVLGTVAHELRSPLAAVLSGVNCITSDCELEPVARRILASIEYQLWQAMRLVDDVFDLCAGGLDKLSVRKETVALVDVVTRATKTASRLLAARQHRLTVSLPPEPLSLEADPLRLAQVLTNLLCNAAKFTDPGGHIRLGAAAEAGQIVFRVKDNGRGIAPDLLPRVFD